jgi:hypothetical protein
MVEAERPELSTPHNAIVVKTSLKPSKYKNKNYKSKESHLQVGAL